ncbi:MAG: hypothetical protein AAGA54_23220 [Myxococcota bacterium]
MSLWGVARLRHLGLAGLVALASTGCSEPPREEEAVEQPTGLDDGTGSPTGNDATSNASMSGPSDESSTGDGDEDIKLDVGPIETSGNTGIDPDGSDGCKKVDFLFVIDNSGSMGDEQQNLISSFPGFIETIDTTLDEAQDYHVMVIDSDPWVYEGCASGCNSGCTDPATGICDLLNPACFLPCSLALACVGDFQCGVTQPFECEDVLGAGVTYPRGQQASNQDCNFSTGARYMDSSEPDLAATFGCAADVGIGSTAGTEKPMEAMVQAVTPGTAADTCNEGFVRDDAILVVTFITDEDDGNGDSAGNVEGWRQALIAAKGGDETAVVVLGLFGDNDQPGSVCPPLDKEFSNDGAEPSERLRSFVDSWGPRGFSGSVCANSYNDFFTEAVGIIDNTCDEFVPPAG